MLLPPRRCAMAEDVDGEVNGKADAPCEDGPFDGDETAYTGDGKPNGNCSAWIGEVGPVPLAWCGAATADAIVGNGKPVFGDSAATDGSAVEALVMAACACWVKAVESFMISARNSPRSLFNSNDSLRSELIKMIASERILNFSTLPPLVFEPRRSNSDNSSNWSEVMKKHKRREETKENVRKCS